MHRQPKNFSSAEPFFLVWFVRLCPGYSSFVVYIDCMGKGEAKERSVHQDKVGPLLWLPIVVSTIFVLFILSSNLSPMSSINSKESLAQDPSKQPCSVTPTDSIAIDDSLSGAATVVQGSDHQNTSPPVVHDDVVEKVCDMSMGRWVREPRGPVYTNVTCNFMPDIDNCGKYGKDPGYQYWRWQPDACDLPRFDPAAFLDLVRGKTMAFVGDSLSRNHMESLLCLLSLEETPVNYSEDLKYQRWQFPSHNFTTTYTWTEFFVNATQIAVNGTLTALFDIHLDKMNSRWADKLPGLDYLILSGGNWHMRMNHLHEGGRAIGCVGCTEGGLPDVDAKFSIRKVVRAALEYISQCRDCAGLTTLMRTFTFSHFEGGSWYDGGYCNKTAPLEESQIDLAADLNWEIRNIQLEEITKIRERLKGKSAAAATDVQFGFLDVSKAMMLRPDAHPGFNLNKGYGLTDCLHWCLPGPIDLWNEVLLDTLRKKSWLH